MICRYCGDSLEDECHVFFKCPEPCLVELRTSFTARLAELDPDLAVRVHDIDLLRTLVQCEQREIYNMVLRYSNKVLRSFPRE